MLRTTLLAAVLFIVQGARAQEVCDNGVDDDSDGLVDLRDTTDCSCVLASLGGSGSLIPNPSFEEQDCVPADFSQLTCATGWEQATDATSDYCSSNGFMPWFAPSQPAVGIGMAGAYCIPSWMEYLGACLLSPMLQGQTYSITLQLAVNCAGQPTNLGPIDITIFGNASCPTFPISTVDCPVAEGWTELGHATYTPAPDWSYLTITFTPTFDVQSVMLGGPCVLPPEYDQSASAYFVYDDLQLAERVDVHVQVEDNGSLCSNDRMLIMHPDTVVGEYQWYLDSVALVGRTDTILDLSALGLGAGDYQFRIMMGDTACAIFPYTVEQDLPPVLRPALDIDHGCAPLTVGFSHTTDPDSISTVWWAFGDGDTAFVAAPTHTYTDPGVYPVTFHVVSPQQCVGDTVLSDTVRVDLVPEARFTADPTEGCAGMQVQFTNTTAVDGTYAWTFGDGGTSTDEDPLHTYDQSGLHDVRLTVTTPQGCVDDTLMQDLINTHPDPDVSFTATPLEGCAPFDVQFTNTTPASQVDSVHWDLGQDSTSTAFQPTTRYTVPGTYTVRLSVTDNVGCTADSVAVDMIVAHEVPVPSFTFSPDSGCYPLEVSVVNTTDPGLTGSCLWDFGDGGTSTVCDTAHRYTEAGLYSIRLQVTSAFGCQQDTTMSDIITVFDHPVAAFTYGPQPTDIFSTEQAFVNTSSSDAITWDWTFTAADPDSASVPDPVVLFPGGDPGDYPVQLVVSNVHGCLDTTVALVEIRGYFSVYAPNAFTPDGDGLNDRWRPVVKDVDLENYSLTVFDRWGREVWRSDDPVQTWDGGDSATSTYAWRLDVRDTVQHNGHVLLGHVTVVR